MSTLRPKSARRASIRLPPAARNRQVVVERWRYRAKIEYWRCDRASAHALRLGGVECRPRLRADLGQYQRIEVGLGSDALNQTMHLTAARMLNGYLPVLARPESMESFLAAALLGTRAGLTGALLLAMAQTQRRDGE